MAKFKPGQSGNPNGRPAGAKSTAAQLRKELITDEDLQSIVDMVIGKAKEGDLAAAGMILDRRLPKLRMSGDLRSGMTLEELISAQTYQVVTGVEGGLTSGHERPAPDRETPRQAAPPRPIAAVPVRSETPAATPLPPPPTESPAIRLHVPRRAKSEPDDAPYNPL